VSEISDAALVASLRRQMTIAAARQVVAAGNLANANTPGFKAQQVEFSDTLEATLVAGLKTTHPGHLQVPGASAPATREAEGLAARRDGNTVQLDRELLDMTRASGDFARAQTALAAKFRLIRYALNEGR
jgi:flagellar basal-body rod protein FlgB